jgi:HEAT repeat protein
LLLLLVLAGLIVYAYVPISISRSADDVGGQLRALRSWFPSYRKDAVVELARLADKDSARIVPALIQAASDQDAGVRYAAIGALHVTAPDGPMAEQAVAVLIPALRDSDPRVRSMAADILSTYRPAPKAAIPELIAAARLGSSSPDPSGAASGASGSSGTGETSIDRSHRFHARASAITALGGVAPNDAEVEKVVVSLAADPVIEVRAAVAETLAKMGSESVTAFATEEKLASDADLFVQAQAITALGSFPKNYVAASPFLYRAYLSRQKPLVDGSKLALARIVKSPVFDAAAARKSKEAPLRFMAIFGLKPDSDEGFPLLVGALKDEDPGVRFLAAMKLGEASSKKAAARQALEAHSGEKDAGAREAILRSINLLAL